MGRTSIARLCLLAGVYSAFPACTDSTASATSADDPNVAAGGEMSG